MQTGTVYLVGAGPGDPGLLTLKAKECLEKADVVVYDYLANEQLLKYVRPQAEQIYVGKKAGQHTMQQKDINRLLVDLARKYACVTRLKGGDPFVFGRGGEEALELVNQQIPFEIVPGIPAGIAATAYAGIPVTHRNVATNVAFITGHESEKPDGSASVNWDIIGKSCDTIVVYMGIKNLPHIVQRVLDSGRDPQTPAAIIRRGTYPSQITLSGKLETIAHMAKDQQIAPPALIVIGNVVSLRNELAWFDRRPLFGQNVLVTRNKNSEARLTKQLEEQGAEVLSFPTIEIAEIAKNPRLERALDDLADYNYLLFTSGNAVDIFFKQLFQRGHDVRALHNIKIAAIGKPGLERLQAFHLNADLLPPVSTSESLVDKLIAAGLVSDKRILFPCSSLSSPETAKRLRQSGAEIDEIPVYENRVAQIEPEYVEQIKNRIAEGRVDWISFTSSSTVTNFLEILGADFVTGHQGKFSIASIGPITNRTLEQHNLSPTVTADEHTFQGLVAALIKGEITT